jgi:hypothetical protein
MLYREIMAVCVEIHTKHINILCGQNVEVLNVKPVVHTVTTVTTDSVRAAQKTHPVCVIKTSQLMLYRKIIAVCSEIHTKHKYTVWAERRFCER